jgi:hypothetical protein
MLLGIPVYYLVKRRNNLECFKYCVQYLIWYFIGY